MSKLSASLWQARVEAHSRLRQFKGAIERSGTEIVAIERFVICAEVSPGQHRSSTRVSRVDRQALFEQTLCLIERRFGASGRMQEKGFRAAQVIIIGLPGGGRFQQRSLDLSAVHMGSEDRDDRARHLVLDRECVEQLAVVPLAPSMSTGGGIDELRRDENTIAAPLD